MMVLMALIAGNFQALFDWMPGWRYRGLPIDWILLLAFCFILAGLFVFDPCQTTVFAGMAGNNC